MTAPEIWKQMGFLQGHPLVQIRDAFPDRQLIWQKDLHGKPVLFLDSVDQSLHRHVPHLDNRHSHRGQHGGNIAGKLDVVQTAGRMAVMAAMAAISVAQKTAVGRGSAVFSRRSAPW